MHIRSAAVALVVALGTLVLACNAESVDEPLAATNSAIKRCETFTPGDDRCPTEKEWRETAARACGDTGVPHTDSRAAASHFRVKDECGHDRFRSASFDCCAKEAAAPANCFDRNIELPRKACADHDALLAQADEACAASGAATSTFAPRDARGCDQGQFHGADVTCCPAAP